MPTFEPSSITREATPSPDANGVSAIHIVPVRTRKDLKTFIRLPWKIYADDPAWVPPLLVERLRHLSSKHNPYFDQAEVQLWLALQDGEVVGRLSAQIDRRFLEKHDAHTGHIGFLEAVNSKDVFEALLAAAEEWLRSRNMRRSLGPFNFSVNDECGVLVEGFDDPPMLMMGHARPYYGSMLEQCGYQKAKDLIAYLITLSEGGIPPSVSRLVDRGKHDPKITLRPLNWSAYEREMAIIADIFNDAWSENWGFLPFAEKEIRHLAKEVRPLINSHSVCFAEFEGRPVAFAMALPNLNEAIRDLDGRLFPFGWARLLYRLKLNRVSTVRVPLMGVRKEFQATPLGAVFAYGTIENIYASHLKRGIKKSEMSWILEDNTAMRNMIEAIGGRPYKVYRMYEKAL